jgi:hypothetical protein
MLTWQEKGLTLSDEEELLDLIDRWAKAVRDQDLDGIRASHDPDIRTKHEGTGRFTKQLVIAMAQFVESDFRPSTCESPGQ